jgi:protocatechuate 4,5-dioxygenase beta chain
MAIGNVPQPLAAAKETPEVRRAFADRIEAGFDALRRELEAYRPDALIMVTDDHSEMYDENICQPTLAMFLGEVGTGVLGLKSPGQDPTTSERVSIRCDTKLANDIANGLLQRDFDLTVTRTKETRSIGAVDRGMGHGFTRTAPKVMPNLDIPTVLIWINCYYDPMPTARRCRALGQALTEICAKQDKRIAIFSTGGLSHDPRGPRAGWIDEPLDRSVLKAFAEGEPSRLDSLFTFESDTFHGGTGEIRCWLVVGGAMGACKATIIDYMPVHHIITGVGFAAWKPG